MIVDESKGGISFVRFGLGVGRSGWKVGICYGLFFFFCIMGLFFGFVIEGRLRLRG